jgi:uncharacterized LabA/DUF88 family protein
MNGNESAKVAIYWDFENVHAVLADRQYGEGAYRANRFSAQPTLVSLEPIISYAASFGDVIINKAYGNWQWFAKYGDTLNVNGIDLIQLYPRGTSMKNSADIRMALDALGDIHVLPHITHLVIVSSDSDFISLAQKVKQSGRFVAGVGISGIANKYWMSTCNEFKFYEALLSLSESAKPQERIVAHGETPPARGAEPLPGVTLDDARDALMKAMTQLIDRNGENLVAKGAVKVFIKRLLPAFDESALGFGTFTEFLLHFPELIRQVDAISGGHVELVNYTPHAVPEPEPALADPYPDGTFELQSPVLEGFTAEELNGPPLSDSADASSGPTAS